MQQASLTQIGGKGIFIKELEEALLEESIDLAVHSVKDIPTETPGRLHFPAVCRRDDLRDCLISHTGTLLANLKQGARVGTSRLRRQAHLAHYLPHHTFPALPPTLHPPPRNSKTTQHHPL